MVASSSGSIPVNEASASQAGLCRATHQAPLRDQGSPHHSTRTPHNPSGCIVALPSRPRAPAALPRHYAGEINVRRLTGHLPPNELHPTSFGTAQAVRTSTSVTPVSVPCAVNSARAAAGSPVTALRVSSMTVLSVTVASSTSPWAIFYNSGLNCQECCTRRGRVAARAR